MIFAGIKKLRWQLVVVLAFVMVYGMYSISQAASGTLNDVITALQEVAGEITDAQLNKLNANRDAVLTAANSGTVLADLQLSALLQPVLNKGWDNDQVRFTLRLAMRSNQNDLQQYLAQISNQYEEEMGKLAGADPADMLSFLIAVDGELTGKEFSNTDELKLALANAFMNKLGSYSSLKKAIDDYLVRQGLVVLQLLAQPSLLPGYNFYRSLININSYLLQEPVEEPDSGETTGSQGGLGGALPPPVQPLPPVEGELLNLTEPTAVVVTGGALKLNFPAAAVQVPAGQQALMVVDQLDSEAAAATIQSANPASDWRGLGPIFRLQLRVGLPGQEQRVTSLEKPVGVELSYAGLDLQGLDPGSLEIFRIPDEGGSIYAQGGRLDRQQQVIRAQVKGFSSFTLGYQERSFTDLEGHWARQDVLALAARGVVNGVAAGSFAPNVTITRAELAALLVRALNVPVKPVTASRFSDVAASAWYAAEVEAAAEAGLVAGYPDGGFAPNATVTRLELAVMLGRALRASQLDWDAATVEAELVQFADAGLVPAWARADAALIVNKQIIRGLPGGLLAPAGLGTRAEAAVMLWRLMQQDRP